MTASLYGTLCTNTKLLRTRTPGLTVCALCRCSALVCSSLMAMEMEHAKVERLLTLQLGCKQQGDPCGVVVGSTWTLTPTAHLRCIFRLVCLTLMRLATHTLPNTAKQMSSMQCRCPTHLMESQSLVILTMHAFHGAMHVRCKKLRQRSTPSPGNVVEDVMAAQGVHAGVLPLDACAMPCRRPSCTAEPEGTALGSSVVGM